MQVHMEEALIILSNPDFFLMLSSWFSAFFAYSHQISASGCSWLGASSAIIRNAHALKRTELQDKNSWKLPLKKFLNLI